MAALRDSAALDGVFLICTIGEFNAGKSSLINALLSTEHCQTGVLPTTSAVTLLGDSSAPSPCVIAKGLVRSTANPRGQRPSELATTAATTARLMAVSRTQHQAKRRLV